MKKSVCLLALLVLAVGVSAVLVQAYGQAPTTNDKASIEALVRNYNDAFNARDVDKIMSCYATGKGLFVFDAIPPREYPSWDAYKKDWEGLFSAYPGPVKNTVSELDIAVVGSVAYGHSIQAGTFTRKDGSKLNVTVRVTDVYRKLNGKW